MFVVQKLITRQIGFTVPLPKFLPDQQQFLDLDIRAVRDNTTVGCGMWRKSGWYELEQKVHINEYVRICF